MVRQVEARQITDETRAMAVELGSEFRLSVRKNERPEDFSKGFRCSEVLGPRSIEQVFVWLEVVTSKLRRGLGLSAFGV